MGQAYVVASKERTAMDLQTATTLWLANGTTVTIHADPGTREAALGKLQSANHAALRASQAGPGESVTKFGQVELPAD